MIDPAKRAMIAKIHIAKKQLGLDDDVYRAMLKSVTGKDSTKGMSGSDLSSVLKNLERLGFKANTQTKKIGQRKLADSPEARKIRALWIDLRDMGELRDSSEEALVSFVKRTTGIHALEWLNSHQAGKVIDALRGWIQRKGGDPNAYSS